MKHLILVLVFLSHALICRTQTNDGHPLPAGTPVDETVAPGNKETKAAGEEKVAVIKENPTPQKAKMARNRALNRPGRTTRPGVARPRPAGR